MFRHSEIQALLRERRHDAENRDDFIRDRAERDTSKEMVGGEESLLESGEEDEYARFLEQEQKQLRAEITTKRRKIRADVGESWCNSTKGDRKSVRELDGATVQFHGLDYGDGTEVMDTSFDRADGAFAQSLDGRNMLVYDDDIESNADTSNLVRIDEKRQGSREKKTFQWPRIGV